MEVDSDSTEASACFCGSCASFRGSDGSFHGGLKDSPTVPLSSILARSRKTKSPASLTLPNKVSWVPTLRPMTSKDNSAHMSTGSMNLEDMRRGELGDLRGREGRFTAGIRERAGDSSPHGKESVGNDSPHEKTGRADGSS